MTPDGSDRRTTPPLLRIPALLGLVLLAGYFFACFTQALGPSIPRWSMLGNWQMFSVGGNSNSSLEAEFLLDGQWVAGDLASLFPSRFESGPRYRTLRYRGSGLTIVADSACDRNPGNPKSVRLFEERWPIRVGRSPALREGAKRKVVLEWQCSRTAARPKGIRL